MVEKQALTIFSELLLTLGLVFYFSWSLLYNAWFDVGVYSLSIILIVFGILGLIFVKIQ